MLRLAWQNIWRRKGRTVLVILGIMQAVVLFLILSALMVFFQRDVEKQITGLTNVVVVQKPAEDKLRFPPTDSELPEEQANQLLGLSGTVPEASSPVLFHTVVPSVAPMMPPSLSAVGILPGREQAYLGNAAATITGQKTLQGEHDAIIGFGAAEILGGGPDTPKAIGDTIKVKGQEFKVVGILPKTNMLIDATVLVPLSTLQATVDKPGRVTVVMLTASGSLDPVVDAARKAAPDLQPVTPTELARDAGDLLASTALFFQSVRGTVLVVAVLIVMTVMMMAIQERRRDIGTLRALGASPAAIVRLVAFESILFSTVAGALGTAIATSFSLLFFDRARVDGALALQSILASIIVGALASLLPAYLASRVNPVESLRYE